MHLPALYSVASRSTAGLAKWPVAVLQSCCSQTSLFICLKPEVIIIRLLRRVNLMQLLFNRSIKIKKLKSCKCRHGCGESDLEDRLETVYTTEAQTSCRRWDDGAAKNKRRHDCERRCSMQQCLYGMCEYFRKDVIAGNNPHINPPFGLLRRSAVWAELHDPG